MGWLGLDDTDSLNGGCTTEVLFRLLESLPDTVSYANPRLVRLWPFAKQRTRGNAAVAVELITENETELMKHLDHWWTHHISNLGGSIGVSDHSERKQYPADPGMVWMSEEKFDAQFYSQSVSSEILLEDLPNVSRHWGGNGRIGRLQQYYGPLLNAHMKQFHGELMIQKALVDWTRMHWMMLMVLRIHFSVEIQNLAPVF